MYYRGVRDVNDKAGSTKGAFCLREIAAIRAGCGLQRWQGRMPTAALTALGRAKRCVARAHQSRPLRTADWPAQSEYRAILRARTSAGTTMNSLVVRVALRQHVRLCPSVQNRSTASGT